MLDDIFHALSDPTRRDVLARLGERRASVSELAQSYEIALPTFMQHLKVLERSGLIRSAKQGRVRTCERVQEPLTEAEQWLADQRAVWEKRLDQLDSYLTDLHRTQTDSPDTP